MNKETRLNVILSKYNELPYKLSSGCSYLNREEWWQMYLLKCKYTVTPHHSDMNIEEEIF